jgi:FKBP-type peptidyl-prolyl cis-trans isomerase
MSREKPQDTGKIKEHLVNANKIFVENEAEQIAAYQERHKLEMKTSGTGLRYLIFSNGKDTVHPKPGDTVSVNYQVYLLDGTFCYNTESTPVDFLIGKDEMPRGMEEAIEMMHTGDSSVIILPSHLAYGFTGDGDKIPGNSATIYYLSLKKITGPQ